MKEFGRLCEFSRDSELQNMGTKNMRNTNNEEYALSARGERQIRSGKRLKPVASWYKDMAVTHEMATVFDILFEKRC